MLVTDIINKDEIEKYLRDFDQFLLENKSKYINTRLYDEWLDNHKYFLDEIEKFENNSNYQKIVDTYKNKSKIIKDHNKQYLALALKANKKYFDDMFINVDSTINLDLEQRKVLLADEDNLLVIAGAGSGKTTTMIAKVKYLIDRCGYKESEIAVISFTKKVAEEITDKLHESFGLKNTDVFTFHSLGLKILKSSGKNINKIAEDDLQYKIISRYIKNILFEDKEKFNKFYTAFSDKLYNIDDTWKDFATFKDYHNYIYKKKMEKDNFDLQRYNSNQMERRRKYYKTINGEYVKSKEEVDIANFLYVNNIEYRYEQVFEKAKSDNVVYNPDFYITQLEKQNYIEHFGVTETGFNDMYSKEELESYLNNIKVKKKYHNQIDNKGLFIINYSSYGDGKGYIDHLQEELLKKGYQSNKLSEEAIYERLKDTSEDSYIANFVDKVAVPFISLFKEENKNVEDFDMLKEITTADIQNQLDVMKDIFLYYQSYLSENYLIDFQDMIYEAYKIMPTLKEKNMGIDYKYIIIDEYQDISRQRFNLTKRISDLFDAKIMAVGDDWQTIFGYAGAKTKLFRNFRKYLNNAKYLPIENTYRNSQELIDIAGRFVMKNQNQIVKNLKSSKHLKNPVEIYTYNDNNRFNNDLNRSKVIDKILSDIQIYNKTANVLLLGRYNGGLV